MEKKSLNQKLLEFQNSIEVIKKDGQNTFFKKANGKASTYATLPNILAEVKPILNALKVVLTQPCDIDRVSTVLMDAESGEIISSSIPMPTGLSAQQMGSAITYFRRYTLSSLLALEIDEDDDGNAASAPKPIDDGKEWLNKYTDKAKTVLSDNWNKVTKALQGDFTIAQIELKYKLSKELKAELIQIKEGNI